jgi:plasmid stabilization system protein ParE
VTRPVHFEPEAASELVDAGRWYEEQADGLGAEFIAAVDATIESISNWPHTGSPVEGITDGPEVRRAPVDGFPYSVAYAVTGEAIQVMAVAHDRRRPAYWTGR